jgi:hypothetical protein
MIKRKFLLRWRVSKGLVGVSKSLVGVSKGLMMLVLRCRDENLERGGEMIYKFIQSPSTYALACVNVF